MALRIAFFRFQVPLAGFEPSTCRLLVPVLLAPPQSEKAPMKVPSR